MKNEQTELVST